MSEPHAFRCEECEALYDTMTAFVRHAILKHAEHVAYLIGWCYLPPATFAWWSAAQYGDSTGRKKEQR